MRPTSYASSLFVAGASAAALRSKQSWCPAQSATSFALTYGAPLLAFEQALNSKTNNGTPVINALVTQTALSTPEYTTIVAPNTDTLYMWQAYDVSSQDVQLAVPEVDVDRYYGVAWYTPYGDNYVTFGTVTSAVPGTYLLTVANSSVISGTMQPDPNGEYAGVLHSPTTFGILLIRILVKNTGDDLTVVHDIQKGFTTTLTDRPGARIGPELTSELFKNSSSSEMGYLMNVTARFGQAVPRVDDGHIIPLNTTMTLALAGVNVNSGAYDQPGCVNLTEASAASALAIEAFVTASDNRIDLGNDWGILKPDYMGDYDTHYEPRAYISEYGYLGMVEDEALYPSYNQTFSLQANESYTLQFGGKPPVSDIGFWSLTMYNATGYLFENPISRWSLGDRSNLTYADGTLVYGSDVNSTFEILVQATQPPSNWSSNWLPSPSVPGPFIILLRLYAPTESLQNGDYAYPKVIKDAAIAGGSN